ncbi:GPDA1 [Enterospora canceri]|uniref:Glycerol-3-phosphate dehydrogenase [NAD(+)] n=1 Tax=Enterospora canceri TaxID=1081671 RepID=A0A1Y1S4Y5_9MICR|nr:GPDA1 [Enterospora canceri]
MHKRVAIIGCGNWGATVANLIANGLDESVFGDEILMYTHETMVEYKNKKRKLSELINHEHVNPKYLPGIEVNKRIRAVVDFTDLTHISIMIVCLPHQYLNALKNIDFIRNGINKDELMVINLSKGLVTDESGLPITPSEYISRLLGVNVSTLQGANIANEIADGCYAETLIGYHKEEEREIYAWLFGKRHFRVSFVKYNPTIEMFGALKNVISLAMGIIDGMAYKSKIKIKVSSNTKAMIFRKGLVEIMEIAKLMKYDNVKRLVFESCGVADLFVSCLAGRNYKCGQLVTDYSGSNILNELESNFNGQKIQGLGTVEHIHDYLKHLNKINEFELVKMVYEVFHVTGNVEPVYKYLEK